MSSSGWVVGVGALFFMGCMPPSAAPEDAGVSDAGARPDAGERPFSCAQTNDRAVVSGAGWDDRAYSCLAVSYGSREGQYDGVITSVGVSEFAVDGDAPDAGEDVERSTFFVGAPGLDLRRSLVVGDQVSVSITTYMHAYTGCSTFIGVSGRGFWDGGAPESDVFLVVADGWLHRQPFVVASSVALNCYPEEPAGQCGSLHEAYYLRLQGADFAVDAPMGQELAFSSRDAGYVARNLRSYSSGICDDSGNTAYWVARRRAPDGGL